MARSESDSFSRGLIKYTSRDYDTLLAESKELVPKLTALWKPEADDDPGVVLGIFLSSVADMLGVNLDIQAGELFAPSVTQRKNAEKLFGLIGYTLGWYTAARTEVTFTNTSENTQYLNFGFNGANFATLNAYTDITGQSRVITYNILPMTNKYGLKDTRSKRETTTSSIDVFAFSDPVTLAPGASVTRVAIEGELRSYSVSVQEVIRNNYIIKLPSQHIDTTAIWIRAKASQNSDAFLETQWVQCASVADFITPEPRFAVTYDSYSNAQVQISNYLNQLENYSNNYLTIYWIDCSGVIGCVGQDVLSNYLQAVDSEKVIDFKSGEMSLSNLSNTVELPHTNVVTGRSPETAKEAYRNSRNYVNTNDSLITLPDFGRFLNREPGVDCGFVVDCQKALEINMAIYKDPNLSDSEKAKMYITNYDFPAGEPIFNWETVLNMGFDPTNPQKYVFASNFKRWTVMCFAIHNDFKSSSYGSSTGGQAQVNSSSNFIRYKPPQLLIDNIVRDYLPLQALTVDLDFGYLRIFQFCVVGQIYTKKPVSQDVADNIVATAKEALALYFAPANRQIGQKPTLMEVVSVIERSDSRIDYFDASSLSHPVISWRDCDVAYFNAISFPRYIDVEGGNNLRVAPECIMTYDWGVTK